MVATGILPSISFSSCLFLYRVITIISISVGGSLIRLICPIPSLICLPYYLKFILCSVYGWLTWLWDGWVCLWWYPFSMCWNVASSCAGSMWYALEVGYMATRVFDSGWIEYFGGQSLYWVLFNFGKVKKWFQCNDLKVFWFFCYVNFYFVFVLIYYLNSLWFRAWHCRCQWGIYCL